MSPILSTFSLGRRATGKEKNDLVYFSHSSSINSATVDYPAGIRANDIAILLQSSYLISPLFPTNAPADVIPSGYTSAGTGSVNSSGGFSGAAWRMSFCYKRLTGGESGSITGIDFDNDRKVLVILRSSGAFKTYTITNGLSDAVGQYSSGDPPSQALNWSGKNKPFIFLLGYSSTGSVTSDSLTNYSYTSYDTTGDQLNFGISLQLTSGTLPSNATADMGDHGDNFHFHSYLQLS